MVGARIALDAAFFAEMMAKGYLSEDEYLNDQKKRSRLGRTAWDELKKGNKLDERVRLLLQSMNALSEHGAHPSPPTWANRIVTRDEGTFLSFFQEAIDSDHLKYHFLSILWHGGMALESFFHIGREVFQQDTDCWLSLLREWKGRIKADAAKSAIGPPA